MHPIARLPLLAATLLLLGCEKPFEPFLPNDDAPFSIYGHLEVGVDTQWIRVRPTQASPEEMRGPIDAVVTLEELETKTVVQMNDSIITFKPSRFGDASISVHAYYTAMPIVPGRLYRVTATRADGASATSTTRAPNINPTLDATFYADPSSQPRGALYGVDYLAMAFGDTDIPADCNYFAPFYREVLGIQAGGSAFAPHTVRLTQNVAPPDHSMSKPTCNPNRWGERRITIVASGAPWLWTRDHAVGLQELLLRNVAENIEDGRGFFGAIERRVYPFEPCTPVTGTSCRVTYNSVSASLVGKVTDSCGAPFVSDANVRLLESGGNAIRTTRTNAEGRFRIQGLNPGRPHTLSMTLAGYFDYESEPLVFPTAGVDTVTFVMTARRC